MTDLNGKIALVTGGASGLGYAIARRLRADGATVIITDIQAGLGEAAATDIGATFLPQDVTVEADWHQTIGSIQRQFGGLHILVNNAGILAAAQAVSPEHTPLDDWQRLFAVNVDGVFLGCKTVIPAMRDCGGGSIVNISSVAGLLATPYATAYGATKATVTQLTKSVAQYCAQERLNIRCNSVHPGDVRTPLWDKWSARLAAEQGISVDQVIAKFEAMIPTGRMTRPEDISAAVAFLASDDAQQITGIELPVDGGFINCSTYLLFGPGGLMAATASATATATATGRPA
jgi:3(or 17)beta-hydroxysteroid dehydrogenase